MGIAMTANMMANAIGVTKPALFRHFPTKEALTYTHRPIGSGKPAIASHCGGPASLDGNGYFPKSGK